MKLDKKEFNVLLIGNSYSYYWPDELWGLLTASGLENVCVCNVYYSGCTFEMHWNWYLAGEKHYKFCIHESTERRVVKPSDLNTCLEYRNWDVISFQQSGRYIYTGGEEAHRASIKRDLPQLYEMVRSRFPKARYYWQQNWTHGIGYGVRNLEEQKAITDAVRRVSLEVCEEYGFVNVPLGDAWEFVRHDPLIREGGKTLTTRIFLGKPNHDDLSHDGDVGGGQYLNACVWYEMLTGKSCLENSFRPKYEFEGADLSLSEEKIALLQNAAHEAVAAAKQK